MELTILQTADAFRYSAMLRATSKTAIEYCRRHGFTYESFVGVKRGFRPAHAAFNRILMLDELVDRGYRGWALHMDADAYVHDLDFNVRAYLEDKEDHSAIMATIPGQPVPWAINSGVLFFNLDHPRGVALIAEWKRRFMRIPDDHLRAVRSVWQHENDQTMLFNALDEDASLREPVLFEDAGVFNRFDAIFIRQYLNSFDGNVASRTDKIIAAVDDAMRGSLNGISGICVEDSVVADLYRALFDRMPDKGSRGYSELIAARGMARGIPEVVRLLLESPEFEARFLTKLDQRTPAAA